MMNGESEWSGDALSAMMRGMIDVGDRCNLNQGTVCWSEGKSMDKIGLRGVTNIFSK